MKANIKQVVPFFVVSNMERSLRFYVEGLGFEMKHKWINGGRLEWCWLEIGHSAIMLQEFGKSPSINEGGSNAEQGVSIYFICEDALSIYDEMISKNIEASEPFVGNNMWVTAAADPDGYKIFFESVTDVPEGTKLSGWRK